MILRLAIERCLRKNSYYIIYFTLILHNAGRTTSDNEFIVDVLVREIRGDTHQAI